MAFVEMSAKTVDEAVAKALKELNITADEAVVEVLEEGKKGFLGMFSKDAKVRVSTKEKAVEEVAVEVEETVIEKAEVVVEEIVEEVKEVKEVAEKVFEAREPKKFVNKNDGTVTFKLHGADMGILIGKHGQTLDSLQYLTNLVANKNSADRVRVIIDVEDYRDRRVETLNRLAYRLADKVKRSGERVALEPMNPHERKIIHMALQNDRRVTTLSEGDEPYRHVVIELKK